MHQNDGLTVFPPPLSRAVRHAIRSGMCLLIEVVVVDAVSIHARVPGKAIALIPPLAQSGSWRRNPQAAGRSPKESSHRSPAGVDCTYLGERALPSGQITKSRAKLRRTVQRNRLFGASTNADSLGAEGLRIAFAQIADQLRPLGGPALASDYASPPFIHPSHPCQPALALSSSGQPGQPGRAAQDTPRSQRQYSRSFQAPPYPSRLSRSSPSLSLSSFLSVQFQTNL